jgi:hypothetical protein
VRRERRARRKITTEARRHGDEARRLCGRAALRATTLPWNFSTALSTDDRCPISSNRLFLDIELT